MKRGSIDGVNRAPERVRPFAAISVHRTRVRSVCVEPYNCNTRIAGGGGNVGIRTGPVSAHRLVLAGGLLGVDGNKQLQVCVSLPPLQAALGKLMRTTVSALL